MSYKYTFILELIDEDASDIDFESEIGVKKVEDAKEYFNKLNTRNPKKIRSLNIIGKHRLEFNISSEEILQVPTKAMVSFTRQLIKIWPEIGEHTVGKRLFRGISSNEIDIETKFNNIDDISDVDALKVLIDIFVNKSSIDVKEKKLRNITINEVKECLLNYFKNGGNAKKGI